VQRNGKMGLKGSENQRLGGYEHSKVLFENLSENARQNPALVREKLLEEFGDPKDFQNFLYAISASEDSCPVVSQVAWDVAKELVRKQEAAGKSAAMAKKVLEKFLGSRIRNAVPIERLEQERPPFYIGCHSKAVCLGKFLQNKSGSFCSNPTSSRCKLHGLVAVGPTVKAWFAHQRPRWPHRIGFLALILKHHLPPEFVTCWQLIADSGAAGGRHCCSN